MNEIHVYDCDGVLVDSSHRYRNLSNCSIDLPYWTSHCTSELIAKDALLPAAKRYKRETEGDDIFTIVATARQMMGSDFRYFRKVLGMPDHLIYRKAGDNRKDWEIKAAGLRKILALKQFQQKAVTLWEDNPVTIAALKNIFPHWKYHFVPSFQGA